MCIYFGYVITNLINQKKYIGVHQTSDVNDKYFGSGIHLRRAINKYGKENFTKEIIEYFDNKHQMFLWEAIIVTQDIVDDPMYYNMKLGGFGGWDAATSSNIGRIRSVEHRAKLSKANTGKIRSNETRIKISEAAKRRPMETRTNLFVKGMKAPNKGVPHTKETIEKIRAAKQVTTADTREKMSASRKARGPATAETRAKMSVSRVGKIPTEETRNKLRKANAGHIVIPETRAKLSAFNKGKKRGPYKSKVTNKELNTAEGIL